VHKVRVSNDYFYEILSGAILTLQQQIHYSDITDTVSDMA